MRPTNRSSRSRALRSVCAFALVASLGAAVGCHGGMHGRHARHHGFTSDTSTIQIVTTELGTKNVFIPSTIVVTSGHPVKLSIFNTTDVPHGFQIPALNVAEVLPPKAEHEIELPALEPHQVLQIKCHLHEKHRTATLVVLPAKEP
jgi:heme/copper-type cytochrome/quinol oxidase subunit 2